MRRFTPLGIYSLFILGVAVTRHVPAAEKPTRGEAPGRKSLSDLTGPWQLFVDDCLIDSKSQLTRRYHPFLKHDANPLNYQSNKIGRGGGRTKNQEPNKREIPNSKSFGPWSLIFVWFLVLGPCRCSDIPAMPMAATSAPYRRAQLDAFRSA